MSRTAQQVWSECMKRVQGDVSVDVYNRWFKPIKAMTLVKDELTIQVPNQFFFEYIEEHFIDILGKVVPEVLGEQGRLKYKFLMASTKTKDKGLNERSDFTPGTYAAKDIKNPLVMPGIKQAIDHSALNPDYTFENYVKGTCNQTAFEAGRSIAVQVGKSIFNPLVIYGGVGLGKTHLMHAIGNDIKKNHPTKHIIYISPDRMTSQIAQSIRSKATDELVSYYQGLDVIMMDDIQFLAGKPKTQEIFYQIFNSIHGAGGQIILSSDKMPKQIEGVEARLISRFKWGLTAELKRPDLETRIEILQRKLDQHDVSIPLECTTYVAHHVTDSIRALEGIVVNIMAEIQLNRTVPTLNLMKELVHQYTSDAKREISVEGIQKEVAEYYQIPVERMLSKSRQQELVLARQVSMYVSHELTGASYASIARHFAYKHHTAARHSIKTVKDRMATDKAFEAEVHRLVRDVELSLT